MAKKDIGKDIVENAADKAAEIANTGVDAAKGALGAVGGAIGGLGKKAKAAAEKAVDVAGDVASSAKEAAQGAVEAAQDVAEGAIDKAKELAAGAGDIAQDAVAKVGDVAQDVAEKVGDVAEGAIGAVGTLADGAVDLTKAAATKVGDVAQDVASGAKDLSGAAIAGGAAVIGGAAALAGDAVQEVTGKKAGVFGPLLAMTAIGGLLAYGLVTWAGKGAKVEVPAISSASVPSWFAGLGSKISAKFPWLKLDFKGFDVVAYGEAADAATRDAALNAIKEEIAATGEKSASVIDAITVLGSKEKPVGAALAALGDNPDAKACGAAFSDTMAGRTINFAIGKAEISADSGALLGALTGIANACKAHKIEIAGHTDAKGNAEANKRLSQARADAVKAFWVSKNVPAEGLKSIGYGSDKPLDASGSKDADAKNRRVEFIVS